MSNDQLLGLLVIVAVFGWVSWLVSFGSNINRVLASKAKLYEAQAEQIKAFLKGKP